MKNNNIDIIEIYDTGILTLIYVLIAKFLKIKVVCFLIGMELLPFERGATSITFKRKIKRIGLFGSLKLANKIIYKELHMVKYLTRWSVFDKSVHLHNAVPVYKNIEKGRKTIDIIYANSIRKMRHPILFLEAIKILVEKGYSFNCYMAGFHSMISEKNIPDRESEDEALNYIEKNNLSNFVQVVPFSNNVLDLIKKSKIFVLPSDVIYANYALLEAMSFFCIPVVTNGNGADKIISNAQNGFICNFNGDDIANKLELLLNDENLILELSLNAERTVKTDFSIDTWAKRLFSVYNEIQRT